jgi:hypothetical protein
MLPYMVMGFRIGENHIMGSFIICAFHVLVIKSLRWISGTCSTHWEIVTLYNAGWCRSSATVLSHVVSCHGKCLSCICEAANMCSSSVVLDLSDCERSGLCTDHGDCLFVGCDATLASLCIMSESFEDERNRETWMWIRV